MIKMYHHREIHMQLSIADDYYVQSIEQTKNSSFQLKNEKQIEYTSSNLLSLVLYRSTANEFIISPYKIKSSLIFNDKHSTRPL